MRAKSLSVKPLVRNAHRGSVKERPQILLQEPPPAVRALQNFALGVELAKGDPSLIRRVINQNWIRFSQIQHKEDRKRTL